MNTNRYKLGFIVFSLLFSSQAFAYLDPATGSILLQGLLAAIAGVAVTAGLYWEKIKAFFTRSHAEVIDTDTGHDTVAEQRERGQR